ncbi:hypothetical protein RA876_17660 [Rhodoferax antarcticus]|nr:hypothetical protein RA876_17660 [Rhodoferax antarcticus]
MFLENGIWLGLAAMGFAVLFNVPRRALGIIFLIAALGGLAKLAMVQQGIVGALAAFVGASLIGLLSVLAAHKRKAPPMIFAIPAVIPMIPGFFAYQAMVGMMELMIQKDPLLYSKIFFETVNNGLSALFVMLALSTGVAIPMLLSRKQTVKRLQPDDDLEVEME